MGIWLICCFIDLLLYLMYVFQHVCHYNTLYTAATPTVYSHKKLRDFPLGINSLGKCLKYNRVTHITKLL